MDDFDPVTGARIEKGRSAKDAGWQGVQRDADNSAMDASWRQRGQSQISVGAGADALGAIQLREERLNSQAVIARKKIEAILAEGEAPQPRKKPQAQAGQYAVKRTARGGLSLEDLTEGLDQTQINATALGLDDLDAETRSILGEDLEEEVRAPVASWLVQQATAKLTTGQTIPVWMVIESNSGTEYKKAFRLEEAASRAAAILNQSGNLGDPRLKKLVETHDKYVNLHKTVRALKKAVTEGAVNQKANLAQAQADLQAVALTLGV